MTRPGRWIVLSLALLLATAVLDLACKEKPQPAPPPPPPPKPATTAATSQASTQATQPLTYVRLVKEHYPDCPASKLLDDPLDRSQGAHIRLNEPIYLDRYGHLWITRADAEPTQKVLASAGESKEHFIHEKPVYVQWRDIPGDRHKAPRSTAILICADGDGKTLRFIEESRTIKLTGKSSGYDWADAYSRNDQIMVAQVNGASVFVRTEKGWDEIMSPTLVDDPKLPHAPTQMPLASNGILAYVPAEAGHPGGKKTARFNDGKWSLMQGPEWPGNFLDIIPLSDGSVLQIIVDPPAKDADDQNVLRTPRVHLAMTSPPESSRVDKATALQLIDQLDSRDADVRKNAFQQLSMYGSSLWNIIEEQMPMRPDGVKEKLGELLRNKTDPTLGEMTLVDPRLILAARTNDGGALFYDEAGVSVLNVDGDQTLVSPAWISVLPGRPIHLMAGEAWGNLTPERKKFYSTGDGDWIVVDEKKGPEEIVGTFDVKPILRKSESGFTRFVGIDARQRWLFRDPTAQPPETLIIDPNLPPITPHLPVWEFSAGMDGVVGWDEHDWPAYKDGHDNIWIIDDVNPFHVQDQKAGKFFHEAADVPKPGATSRPTSQASSQPTTSASAPLLVQADGTTYYGGVNDLRRLTAKGATTWKLPSQYVGSFAHPWLAVDREKRLFLFNEPGRILRIRPTPPPATQPFKVEATFTHRIPTAEPLRMWIDPADRLIILHDGNMAAICFPAGVVPPEIADKLPSDARDEGDEEQEQ